MFLRKVIRFLLLCFVTAGITLLFQRCWTALTEFLLAFISSVWQSGADSLYASASKEPASIDPYVPAVFFTLLLLAALIPITYFSVPPADPNNPRPTWKSQIASITPRQRRLYKAASLVCLFMFFINTIMILPLALSDEIRNTFNRKLVIYGPWLPFYEERRLRSDFATMDTEKEYDSIIERMKKVAKQNGFPTYPQTDKALDVSVEPHKVMEAIDKNHMRSQAGIFHVQAQLLATNANFPSAFESFLTAATYYAADQDDTNLSATLNGCISSLGLSKTQVPDDPQKALRQLLEALAQTHKDVKFIALMADVNKALADHNNRFGRPPTPAPSKPPAP